MTLHLTWSDDYATGIPVIDEQHKRIFDYLVEIDAAIDSHSEDLVEDVVIGLLDYAITHNSFEESLMEQAGYPLVEAHKSAHDAFRRRTEDYVRRISSHENRFRLAREIRNDIGLWLTGHIKREDQHYVPYVKQNTDQGFVGRMLHRFFG